MIPDEENPIVYCVHVTRIEPYLDRDNYVRYSREEPDVIQRDTVEQLYEAMAQEVVDHTLHAEKQCREDHWHSHNVESYTVEFSDIYTYVESYSEEKMKATKTYQELGLAREIKREKEKKAAEAERIRQQEWQKQDTERREREEFARLSRKYSK